MIEWMNEWVSEWMNALMNEWMNEWMWFVRQLRTTLPDVNVPDVYQTQNLSTDHIAQDLTCQVATDWKHSEANTEKMYLCRI